MLAKGTITFHKMSPRLLKLTLIDTLHYILCPNNITKVTSKENPQNAMVFFSIDSNWSDRRWSSGRHGSRVWSVRAVPHTLRPGSEVEANC